MQIYRKWAMPNADTFSIQPINELIQDYIDSTWSTDFRWVDPFVRNSPFKSRMWMTNDLNPDFEADTNVDALLFLENIRTDSVNGVLFDPPYSPRQITECYQGVGRKTTMEDTQSAFYSKLKKQIARIVMDDGYVISLGWNSGGIGKTLGFEIQEILLVAHGGWHNDTIVTVERKRQSQQTELFDRRRV